MEPDPPVFFPWPSYRPLNFTYRFSDLHNTYTTNSLTHSDLTDILSSINSLRLENGYWSVTSAWGETPMRNCIRADGRKIAGRCLTDEQKEKLRQNLEADA